jgi:O-antigen ligase
MSDAPLRPTLDRLTAVMIVVATLTLAGGYFLLSAAESLTLVDGAVAWQAESPLRAVVQLLCLNYQFPTINAGDIKGYVLGMGVAVALTALGIAALVRVRDASVVSMDPGDAESFDDSDTRYRTHNRFPLLVAAQFLAVLYLLWSFASVRWSQAPDIAVAGSTLLAVPFLWALLLANTVGAVGVRYIVRGFLVITLTTSLVAVWYYYGRNPTLRAKFPFGNPTFLSACLIPGFTLTVVWICHAICQVKSTRSKSSLLCALLAACALAAALWAFRLTDSRGAQVGLGAAVFTAMFFALRGRWRIAPIALAVMLGVAGWFYYADAAKTSLAGRGDSLRLRGYAWSYALRMFADRPFTGHGQGGYALLGDSFVANDILNDPLVFDGPIDHAHNEWLETLADLGIVGAVLIAAVVVLTLIGVHFSLWRNGDSEHRWYLIGLAGSLVGLAVEECAGVGLRVSEVPVAFYTVLGLTWAGATCDRFKLPAWSSKAAWRGIGLGVVCIAAALGAMSITQLDFQSARSSFEIQQLLSLGKTDEALQLAERGLWRLSPQRALTSRYQIADAYVRWGERAIHRATDRDQKARAIEPADARILELARVDIAMAEEAIRAGGHALKELIERSPGYINSGLLDYRINLVRAQAAFLRNDREASEASRKNAVAGLERELLRQPFRSDLANAYARFARPDVPVSRILAVLARPLRYEPITEETAHSLQELAQASATQEVLARSMSAADSPEAVAPGDPMMIEAKWAPEITRMSAALNFMRGQYETAAAQLDLAAQRYAALPRPPTLGEAATSLERAEALFYANPEAPEVALAQANRAMELAPHSRLGRELQASVRQRMIQYHLAADHEEEALRLLTQSASTRVADDVVTRELGTQLRKLSETLLLQRREAMILRKPADTLFPKLERWLQRAIELNPDDFSARYIAADLALHAGNDIEAANHLREALHSGLDPADAARFLQMAVERAPESAALKALAKELPSPADLASDKKEP